MAENIGSVSDASPTMTGYVENIPLEEQPNKVTDPVTGKILYCNGMTTSHELALTHARTIAALTGIEVELHYNDTTSTAKALAIIGKIGIGTLTICCAALAPRTFVLGMLMNRWIVLAGLSGIVSGMYDLNTIEKSEQASAQILANRVSAYLDANPLHHITLILHSQGADIGRLALGKLADYKDRMNVVTIGGMVDIPDKSALRVVNFVNDNDLIAYLAKRLFGPKSSEVTKIQIKDDKSPYLDSHYSDDYLKREQVKEFILKLVKPHPPPCAGEGK